VLPSAFGPSPLDPSPLTSPDFEVRGFVRITLPPIKTGPGFFQQKAQANRPVKVLLTPQNRATYYGENGVISDQTQATLPTATGQAAYAIPPQLPFFPLDDFAPLEIDFDRFGVIPEDLRAPLLAQLLAEIDAERSDIAGFNAALAQLDVPFTVEKRSGRITPRVRAEGEAEKV
jgi:hypothetical protein